MMLFIPFQIFTFLRLTEKFNNNLLSIIYQSNAAIEQKYDNSERIKKELATLNKSLFPKFLIRKGQGL